MTSPRRRHAKRPPTRATDPAARRSEPGRSQPRIIRSMSDRRAGWLLVIVSGALALVVCELVNGQVAKGLLESTSNAGDAAVTLLIAAAPGILMVVALDVIAVLV